jgi:hypothetical protein
VNTFEIVKEAIDEWDPYSLLEGGSPDDEFDSESRSVSAGIDAESSATDIAHVVSKVFTSSFGESFNPEDCIDVANKIKSAMSKPRNQWELNQLE